MSKNTSFPTVSESRSQRSVNLKDEVHFKALRTSRLEGGMVLEVKLKQTKTEDRFNVMKC